MRDQARALRALAVERRREPLPDPAGPPTLVVGSGKGGVGKSLLSIMLAAAIARSGRRVLLVDAVQNQGNLHILLGLQHRAHLQDLWRGDADPEDLVLGVADRLWLVPADSGEDTLHALTATDRARLYHRLTSLYHRYDAVVVDAGPGIEGVVRAAGIRASHAVVVAVPEPASLSDAYALIKILTLQLPAVPIEVLINRAGDAREAAAAFERLDLAAERFLGRRLAFAGAVLEIPELRRWLYEPATLLAYAPPALQDLAARLAGSRGGSDARHGD
jgi:flagellar biosynthesis protein FlhG